MMVKTFQTIISKAFLVNKSISIVHGSWALIIKCAWCFIQNNDEYIRIGTYVSVGLEEIMSKQNNEYIYI